MLLSSRSDIPGGVRPLPSLSIVAPCAGASGSLLGGFPVVRAAHSESPLVVTTWCRYHIASRRKDSAVQRYFLVISMVVMVVAVAACAESGSPQAASPDVGSRSPTVSPSRSPTVSPSGQAPPSALVRLERAEKRYAAVLAKYQRLYEDPSTLSDAFRLLAQLERRFAEWKRAVHVASQQQLLEVPRTAVREWGTRFEAWLDNQASQQLAVESCAGDDEITMVMLIRCLDTLGPLIHRAGQLSSSLNRFMASEASLSSVLPDVRF